MSEISAHKVETGEGYRVYQKTEGTEAQGMVLIDENTLYRNWQEYIIPCYLYSIGQLHSWWARMCFEKMLKPHPVKMKGKSGWIAGRKRAGFRGKAIL